jgi:hypothetical protein
MTRDRGGDWWRVIDSMSPGSSCVVFELRAAGYSGGPTGRQHAEFTVNVNGTVLAVKLSAEFQGDFSAVAKPNFDLPVPRQVPDWVFAPARSPRAPPARTAAACPRPSAVRLP